MGKIAILGGTGKFGRHLGKMLEEEYEIFVSGANISEARKTAERNDWGYGTNKEIVKGADIVLVAVPIAETRKVIHEVGEYVPEEALFCDITSVKQEPVKAMSEYSNQVLGMHPMYAPTNKPEGQKVVLCPEKGDKWVDMRNFWEEKGAEIHITDPVTHDTAMSLVQGLMHFSELVVADVVRKSAMDGSNMEKFSSPVYQLITDLTARMLNQKPGLYGSIQRENPENEKIREEFLKSAEEMKEVVKNPEKFGEKFEMLGKEFNLEKSQETTDKVIEYLSKI